MTVAEAVAGVVSAAGGALGRLRHELRALHEHTAGVDVSLLDADGGETRVPLEERTAFVWHGYIPGVGPGQTYGLRVSGPADPSHGHYFDPSVLLLDPYARAIDGDLRAIVVDPGEISCDVPRPRTPWEETVIYETHVKGLTMRHPQVDAALRGRYGGVGHLAVVEHLRSLGVTALELMPIHRFVHRRFLLDRGVRQYSGYDAIGFFAPHDEYGDLPSFKRMVRDLHAAWARADPRRRRQPHGRARPRRPDALLPRDRQPQLLPAARAG